MSQRLTHRPPAAVGRSAGRRRPASSAARSRHGDLPGTGRQHRLEVGQLHHLAGGGQAVGGPLVGELRHPQREDARR